VFDGFKMIYGWMDGRWSAGGITGMAVGTLVVYGVCLIWLVSVCIYAALSKSRHIRYVCLLHFHQAMEAFGPPSGRVVPSHRSFLEIVASIPARVYNL